MNQEKICKDEFGRKIYTILSNSYPILDPSVDVNSNFQLLHYQKNFPGSLLGLSNPGEFIKKKRLNKNMEAFNRNNQKK